jgi:hypothetical protein
VSPDRGLHLLFCKCWYEANCGLDLALARSTIVSW